MKKWISLTLLLVYSTSYGLEAHRPKVGLVLSGGGARGSAHIGVIEALNEMQVPIDYIVGTSMGAVIGGLYAAGVPIEDIKRDLTTLNWEEVFDYDIKRDDLYYRRKIDSQILIIQNFISYSHGAFHLPTGIISGQNLYDLFNGYLLPIQPIGDFKNLPIPFKAVATDIVTGKPVVLDQGDLALSMLASMAVPALIAPIDMGKYLLVDGGVSANLPIEIAKSMGADVLIVVETGTPLANKETIQDIGGMVDQLTNILTANNVTISKQALTSSDIYIEPPLKDFSTTDFMHFAKGIPLGKQATYAQADKLKRLEEASTKKDTRPQIPSSVEINKTKIINTTSINNDIYENYLHFDKEIYTSKEIRQKIDHLYGLDIFEKIYYGIEEDQNDKVLIVKPHNHPDNPIYFQGSIFLDTDFQTTNDFSLLMAVTNPKMNSLMGEWRVFAQVGQNRGIGAEYYQPLTTDLAWFFNPNMAVRRSLNTLYYDYQQVARYSITTDAISAALGRNFSHWGRVKIFGEYEYDDFKLQLGSPYVNITHQKVGQVGGIVEWDQIDNVYFPHQGIKGHLSFGHFIPGDESAPEFNQLRFTNLAAYGFGKKHSLALLTSYNRTLQNSPVFLDKFSLGGIFQLTGLASDELIGNNSALVDGIYFYEVTSLNFIPNHSTPIYVGTSLEGGKVWNGTNLSDSKFIESASLFVGADTIIGPLYLAGGITDKGRKAVHLILRPPFDSLGRI